MRYLADSLSPLTTILNILFCISIWSISTTVLAFVLWWMAVAFYRLFLHPLSGVPGPKLAAVSNVWYATQARNGRCRVLGKTLHGRYGPIVRVGPNEVWFNTKEAFKMIYSGGGYEKSNFYRKKDSPNSVRTSHTITDCVSCHDPASSTGELEAASPVARYAGSSF